LYGKKNEYLSLGEDQAHEIQSREIGPSYLLDVVTGNKRIKTLLFYLKHPFLYRLSKALLRFLRKSGGGFI
jgi:hypothetical protein